MKHILITIAAVPLVGCIGASKTGFLKDEEGNLIILPTEPVAATVTSENKRNWSHMIELPKLVQCIR